MVVNDHPAPARRDTAEYYIVKPGDTLWAIAQRYGTTYQEIARLSGISNPSLIFPGQKVRVKIMLPDKVYEALRWLVAVFMPAVGVFFSTLTEA